MEQSCFSFITAKNPWRIYLHEGVTLCYKCSFGDLLEFVADVGEIRGFQNKSLVLLDQR